MHFFSAIRATCPVHSTDLSTKYLPLYCTVTISDNQFHHCKQPTVLFFFMDPCRKLPVFRLHGTGLNESVIAKWLILKDIEGRSRNLIPVFFWELKKTTRNLGQDAWCSCRDSKRFASEHSLEQRHYTSLWAPAVSDPLTSASYFIVATRMLECWGGLYDYWGG
jgi:hypothetical protein